MNKRSLAGLRADQKPKVSQNRMAVLVADRLGRSFSAARYWQIENGYGSNPSKEEQAAIAKVLGAKVSEIAWPEDAKAKAS